MSVALGVIRVGLAITFSVAAASAQADRQLVPANLLIPQPPPSAPLSDWVETTSHATLIEKLPGATLRGWDYGANVADIPVILFFNGNGMTVDRSDSLYRQIAALGAELRVYDYRGIGFSEGQPDVLTFRQDALHLYDATVKARPGRAVIIYGFSLGTAMASYVASQRTVAGLILAGTIASAADEFPVYLRAAGVSPEIASHLTPAPDGVEAFDEVGNVAKSSAPLLMLHGEADRLVPIEQGRKVFAASPAQKKNFAALAGVPHNGTAGAAEAMRAVGMFVAGLGERSR